MTSQIVEHIRKYQTTPKVDIEGLIRSLGIELDMGAVLHPDIVGQIEKIGDHYKISVQGLDHPNRRRFTAAHELGHFLFHRDLLGEGVDDDKMYRSENIGRFYNRHIRPRHETEANKFAASVLMPGSLVKKVHAEQNGRVQEIAREFGVSPAAMRIRLQSLGLAAIE